MSPNNNSPTSPRLIVRIGPISQELQRAFRRATRRNQLMQPVLRRAMKRAADEIVRPTERSVESEG